MKTTLLFIALVTALLADPKPEGIVSLEPSTKAGTASSLYIASPTKSDVTITAKYDILWSSDNAAGKLLSVNGITQIVPVPLTGNPNIWMTRQKAPEKPEEIVVHVWTADGKKWRAKWEEVK